MIQKEKVIRPVIKWSGSKRSQASKISSLIPSHHRYFEPFIGGASVAYAVNPSIAICGDICEPLIDLWIDIRDRPDYISTSYARDWEILQSNGQQHFYAVRDRYNKTGDPAALMFLSRTCVNGLIRFNAKGEFNNSFHLSRPGISPRTLESILLDWSERFQNVEFKKGDYRTTTKTANEGDFVYLDPPYMNTRGRYYGTSTIDFNEFFEFLADLNQRRIKWGLSFDGMRGSTSYAHEVPSDLYQDRLLINSGQSAFKRVQQQKLEEVQESLYLNFIPEKGIADTNQQTLF